MRQIKLFTVSALIALALAQYPSAAQEGTMTGPTTTTAATDDEGMNYTPLLGLLGLLGLMGLKRHRDERQYSTGDTRR
jgi:hypothetical protein